MYDFVDTTTTQAQAELPSEALLFNGQYLEEMVNGYRTLYVSGREMMEAEVTEKEIGSSDGARYQRKRYPPRTITVGYQLIANDNAAFREAYNKLNAILDAEEATLIFNDEPDKYFVGTRTGAGEVPPGTNHITSEIQFRCSDPFKYSVYEKTVSPSADNGTTFLVDYTGTRESHPVFEATAVSDLGFVGYLNQDGKVLQIGNVDEVDGEEYEASQTLFTSSGASLNSSDWSENVATTVRVVSEHKQDGEITVETETGGIVAKASNYGTGSNWHGPSITRLVPADKNGKVGAKNCTFSWRHIYEPDKLSEMGVVQFLMTDNNKENVAAVTFFKNQRSSRAQIHLYVNGVVQKEIDFSTKDTARNIRRRKASSSISKFGNSFRFNIIGRVYQFTISGMEEREVHEVSIFFGGWGTYPPIAHNGVYNAKFMSHSVVAWRDIPNIFAAEDVIQADCREGEIYVNGVEVPGIGAIGNDWEELCLKPGMNQVQCVWSEWAEKPDFKLKYREVFL